MRRRLNLECVYEDAPVGKTFYFAINDDYLKKYADDLLAFLDGLDYMNSFPFAARMILSGEIKANNYIEGITDDAEVIAEVINNKSDLEIPDSRKKKIINLYRGYQFISSHSRINKDSLKELYKLLSEGILDDYNVKSTGQYYRTKPVYIMSGARMDKFSLGMEEERLDELMDMLFEFINSDEPISGMEAFIKSQIIHFYLVYVHPYMDVNGRTSRTLAMWYLLNHKCYPYLVFNRAISFAKREYEQSIQDAAKHGDITLFVKYIITHVQKELEKEYLIHGIEDKSGVSLSNEERQMLEYLLSMKRTETAFSLAQFYNRFNQPKPEREIMEKRIMPLMDKHILVRKACKRILANGNVNYHIGLNPEFIDPDPKVRILKPENFIMR